MTEQVISPFRRRMIDDITMRKFASETQRDSVQTVKEFAAFLQFNIYRSETYHKPSNWIERNLRAP